jgi:hypothetical protein
MGASLTAEATGDDEEEECFHEAAREKLLRLRAWLTPPVRPRTCSVFVNNEGSIVHVRTIQQQCPRLLL